MKVICVTGGLASGKSTAVKHLASKGAVVIDADVLGHQAYNSGTASFDDVIDTFGDDVRGDDGQIDRKVLGGKVFGKPKELRKLTDIVWPEIRRLVKLEIDTIADSNPDAIVVLEAAMLLEAGWEDMGEEVWVLTVDRETAIERSMTRDNATRDAVEHRLDSQFSNEVRTSQADIVVTNDGSVAGMLNQIDRAFAKSTGASGTR